MGEYDGVFVRLNEWLDSAEVFITEATFSTDTPSWIVHNQKLIKKLRKIQPGERVILEVEFNDYTVVGVTLPDLEPRALLARIVALEMALKQVDTSSLK